MDNGNLNFRFEPSESSKNLLTNPKIHDILTTKDEVKENTKKPERTFVMKKVTLETIRTALTDFGYTDTAVLVELDADLNKVAEEKAARDLWGEIEGDVTAKGMTKHNVQYALNNLWQDEIVKIAGKPNTYRRA